LRKRKKGTERLRKKGPGASFKVEVGCRISALKSDWGKTTHLLPT